MSKSQGVVKINFQRIFALIYRDLLLNIRMKWRIAEILYFPITTIIIWGLFALYSKTVAIEAGMIVLATNLFWQFAYLAQSTANMTIMDDTWSGSFRQLMLSGITEFEYIISRLISSTMISVIIMMFMTITAYFFGLDIFGLWKGLIILSLITLISSIALAVVIAGMLVNFGREYGFIAWTALQLFIVLSFPFIELSTLPILFQKLSMIMPFTYIFMAVREFSTTNALNSYFVIKALISSVVYFIISWPIYFYAFKHARKTGKLARLH